MTRRARVAPDPHPGAARSRRVRATRPGPPERLPAASTRRTGIATRRRHRRAARGPGPLAWLLLGLGLIALIGAVLATWTAATALDSDVYADTVAPLADEPAIVAAVGDYAAAEVLARPQLAAELSGRLPADGPVGPAELSDRIEAAIARVMSTEAFAAVWRQANLAAHRAVVAAVREDAAGPVTLDLRPAIGDVLRELGVDPALAETLPDQVGRPQVVAERDLERVRTGARWLDRLATVLPIAAAALLLGALIAAPRGGRLRTMMWLGVTVALAGALTLIGLRIAEPRALDALADPTAREAAAAVWETVLAALVSRAWLLVAVGAGLALIAWLVGRRRLA